VTIGVNSASIVSRSIVKSRRTRKAQYAALAVSAALLLLPLIFRLDGKPHANWEQFLGRFHPLAVHLPIGFLILLPILELAGVSRSAFRETAGLVLPLALAACLFALTLGYLLAYGSGDSGPGVVKHMWGAIALTICVLACLFARPSWLSGQELRVYPTLLVTVLLALVWTAHEGGSLTYGSSYLTEYMPTSLKRLMPGAGPETAATNSFYAQYVNPIFDRNCVSCHGESKIDGGLRLDSYGRLMRGGRDGAVVIAGNPEQSILFQRITLPQSDKHFMPAEGRPPLKPEEIAWIKAWIQQGASPSTTSISGVTVAQGSQDRPIKPVGDYSSLMPEIRQMESGQGAKLVPVSSKPSDGLILSTVDVSAGFGDAQLAQFQKFAPYIVEAELGRTAVTDASFDTLARFTNLRALHLEGTAVTGAGLQKLAPLSQLTYLNLSGTKVTAAAAATLGSMKNLHHVYLFDTPAQPAVTAADATQPVARSTQ
jgi:uncharacterized membrane protein